jgi:hypothetical protein
MARKATRKAQWYAVITCACPKIHFLGFAPSEQEQPKWSPKPQAIRCKCSKPGVLYTPWRTNKPPK